MKTESISKPRRKAKSTKFLLNTHEGKNLKETKVKTVNQESKTKEKKAVTELLTSPEFYAVQNINVVTAPSLQELIDFSLLTKGLTQQAESVASGDTTQVAKMLMNQAQSLQAMQTHLTHKAMQQTQWVHFDGFMRLALKAQAQCARTLQIVSEVSNPQTVILAKQANLAGVQQVNNHFPAQAYENQNTQNQLLKGESNG